MNPIMRLVYAFLRALALAGLRLFYRESAILGRDHLGDGKRSILITNHPNTFMDVANTAAYFPGLLYFLGNAGLFQNPFIAKLLKIFYTIKLERPQDVEGRPLNNQHTFDASANHLKAGGNLFIAPEGTSYLEHRVRPFRTGTARIALQAESENAFRLGVQILPAGVVYSSPRLYWSKVCVIFQPVVDIREYESAYRTDAWEAVRNLTARLENTVREVVLDTRDDIEDDWVRLELLLAEYDDSQSFDAHVRRVRQELLDFQQAGASALAQGVASFRERMRTELEQLERFLSPLDLRVWQKAPALQRLAWPFYALAYVLHWPPHALLSLAARRSGFYPGYDSTVKYCLGLILYPLYYAWFLHHFFSWGILLILLVVSSRLLWFFHEGLLGGLAGKLAETWAGEKRNLMGGISVQNP